MQDDDHIKNWYKESFEAIRGKPVPDVWEEIQSSLPPSKPRFWKFALILPVAIIVGFLLWPGESEKDYFPRTSISTADYRFAISTDVILDELKWFQNLSQSNVLAVESDLEHADELMGKSGERHLTKPSERKTLAHVSNNGQRNGIGSAVNLKSQSVSEPNNNIAFNFIPTRTATSLPSSREPLLAAYPEEEPKNTHPGRYLGVNLGLYNVTMLNNDFAKGLDASSLTANNLYIKPSFSLIGGLPLTNHTSVEFSLTHLSMGQAISTYEEGVYATSRSSVNYVSIGAGLLRRGVFSNSSTVIPYYGAKLEGRFLITQVGIEEANFTNKDVALALAGGLEGSLTPNLLWGTGVSGSLSLSNSLDAQSGVPRSFNRSRNLHVGVDLRLIHRF